MQRISLHICAFYVPFPWRDDYSPQENPNLSHIRVEKA
jgi:hypothetical protein